MQFQSYFLTKTGEHLEQENSFRNPPKKQLNGHFVKFPWIFSSQNRFNNTDLFFVLNQRPISQQKKHNCHKLVHRLQMMRNWKRWLMARKYKIWLIYNYNDHNWYLFAIFKTVNIQPWDDLANANDKIKEKVSFCWCCYYCWCNFAFENQALSSAIIIVAVITIHMYIEQKSIYYTIYVY